MRLVAALLAVLFSATAVAAQEGAEPSPAPVNWLCDNAFVQVELELATESESTASDPASLDDAIRACASVADFEAGAALHPLLLGERTAIEWLEDRCLEPELADYSTCVSLIHVLATPAPSPTPAPTPAPEATPEPAADPPTGSEPKTGPGAKPKVRDGKVRVPSLRIEVPGATRVEYFDINGKTWAQLNRSTAKKTRERCGNHRAQACLETRIANVRPLYRVEGGTCTLTGVRAAFTTIAHMPRWVGPQRVEPELAWVWRKSIARTGWHESKHARIANRAYRQLPKLVEGKPCTRFAKITKRWWRSLTREQILFDRKDYPKSAQVHARWFRQAESRFGS